MYTPTAIWSSLPSLSELKNAAQHFRRLAICLPDTRYPLLHATADNTADQALWQRWQIQTQSLQFTAVQVLPQLMEQTEVWLLPPNCHAQLHDYFSAEHLIWQTPSQPCSPPTQYKPWFAHQPSDPIQSIAIIGAGIAGAATAYELAKHNVSVLVLEEQSIAQAGSGNRQGLLYAKISAHPTEQTELLLGGYGHTLRLLHTLLPEQQTWQACGVLHLNHNESERKRNQALAQQTWHQHLYHAVDAKTASTLAGIPIHADGIFWQQGAWIHPYSLVHTLLQHHNIELHEHTALLHAQQNDSSWTLHTTQGTFQVSHIVYCTAASSPQQPHLAALPWHLIRGQTSLMPQSNISQALKIAVSGASYISPAWQQQHCFGATFVPHDHSTDWRASDEQHNQQELAQLLPVLATDIPTTHTHNPKGHVALRCDSPDHLPTVGRVADYHAMKTLYAKLSDDKNHRIHTPCPYLPNVWVNTAHGSRGLATAPWCAFSIASEILNRANPLSPRLRQALHPNRHIIRALIRQQKT